MIIFETTLEGGWKVEICKECKTKFGWKAIDIKGNQIRCPMCSYVVIEEVEEKKKFKGYCYKCGVGMNEIGTTVQWDCYKGKHVGRDAWICYWCESKEVKLF
jgi:hypothetical protein